MTTAEKRGRPFERLVAAVQRKLDPGAEVHSPFALKGRSGAHITLDATVHGKIGSSRLFVAIEYPLHGPRSVRGLAPAS